MATPEPTEPKEPTAQPVFDNVFPVPVLMTDEEAEQLLEQPEPEEDPEC